jgi:hypothetical protein
MNASDQIWALHMYSIPCFNPFEILRDLELQTVTATKKELVSEKNPSDPKWWLSERKLPVRSSVIPFTFSDDKLWFSLGIDKKTGDLTDFGGGIKLRDFSPVHAARREFKEETKGVFGNCYQLRNFRQFSYSLLKENVFLMFLYVPSRFMKSTKGKFAKLKSLPNDELSGIIWYSQEEFQEIFSLPQDRIKVYEGIQKIISKINFSLLREILTMIVKKRMDYSILTGPPDKWSEKSDRPRVKVSFPPIKTSYSVKST